MNAVYGNNRGGRSWRKAGRVASLDASSRAGLWGCEPLVRELGGGRGHAQVLDVSLGLFQGMPGPERWAALLAWGVSLGLAVVLQRWQVRLRHLERSRWWASNGRDVLNLAALTLLVESLRAMGFARPEALLVGATALLPLVLLSSITARRGRLRALLPLGAVAVGVPIGAAPGAIHALASAIAHP